MKIELKNVSKLLNKKKVLDHINISFESGKVYGIRGYNGSGKTMMLRVISGLMYPTEGEASIDGKILGKDMDFPPSVGILIEAPAFIGNISGDKNLEMILSLRSDSVKDGFVHDMMKKVGLEDGIGLKYNRYSLGMKQRLGIAAAIMEEPELLILDEPTNALDEDGIALVGALIKELRDANRVILVASHERDFLEKVSDVVYQMKEGKILV